VQEVEETPTEPVEASEEKEPVHQEATEETPDGDFPEADKWLKNVRKITVQGQELEVSADEAFKGYMRQQDYTRKTQEAAEQSRKADELHQYVQQEYGSRINQLDALAGSLYRELVGDQQKLASLIESDPQEYLRQQAAMNQKAALLQQAQQAQQQFQAMQANQTEQHRAEQLARSEQQLLEALPSWRDPEKRTAEQKEVAQFLISTGYTPNDLNDLSDHRAVLIARKAMLWDKAQSARQKQVNAQTAPPKAVKPGTSNPTNVQQNQVQQAFAKFKKSGRDDDAVALLMARSK